MVKSSKSQRVLAQDTDVKEMILSATKGQILETFNLLYNGAGELNGGIFCAKLAYLSGLFGQLRRYSTKAGSIYPKHPRSKSKYKK